MLIIVIKKDQYYMSPIIKSIIYPLVLIYYCFLKTLIITKTTKMLMQISKVRTASLFVLVVFSSVSTMFLFI